MMADNVHQDTENPVARVYCHEETTDVFKMYFAIDLPPRIPAFDHWPGRGSRRLELADFDHPQYLDHEYFYLAFLPLDPLSRSKAISPFLEYWNVVSTLDVSRMDCLAVYPAQVQKENPRGYNAPKWQLNVFQLKLWKLVEDDLERAIDVLEPLAFQHPKQILPVRPRAREYGYLSVHTSQLKAQEAAWLSRHVIFAMMAYLAFLKCVCQTQAVTDWVDTLSHVTSDHFVEWALHARVLSDYSPGTRLGGFVCPTLNSERQTWQTFVHSFLRARIPLWINYGPKQETFDKQVVGMDVLSVIHLTKAEFLTMDAKTTSIQPPSPGYMYVSGDGNVANQAHMIGESRQGFLERLLEGPVPQEDSDAQGSTSNTFTSSL